MKSNIPPYLLNSGFNNLPRAKGKRSGLSFLDKTILGSANAVKSVCLQAESGAMNNIMQKINPHVKFISLIYMAVVISVVSGLQSQLLISLFIFSLFILARLKVFHVYRKIFLLAFVFGFLVVLPASLNVITPGKILIKLISFNAPLHFWIYNIPENVGVTDNGLHVVLLVFLRVLNSVSIALLIVFTTPFPSFIKSFKIIGIPDAFLMIITLAYKYIFILSRTIEETYFALKSRISGNIQTSSLRKIISGRIFFVFRKSMIMYENTYYAMVSRGYRGKVKLHTYNSFTATDLAALILIVGLGIFVIILQ